MDGTVILNEVKNLLAPVQATHPRWIPACAGMTAQGVRQTPVRAQAQAIPAARKSLIPDEQAHDVRAL